MASIARSGERSVTCSAPGKVLVAGGYLVLERPNIGLTVATSAKFHTTTEWKPYGKNNGNDLHSRVEKPATICSEKERYILTVVVHSPQFKTNYKYEVKLVQDKVVLLDVSKHLVKDTDDDNAQAVAPSRNPYIETCITYCVTILLLCQNGSEIGLPDPMKKYLFVTLKADNSFYSQREELKRRGWPENLASLRRLPACRPLKKVNKTGLGSSAALVTSFVASILSIFDVVDLPDEATAEERKRGSQGLDLVHRVAQVAHIVAQGKVGSGFDVCAACFGSNRYIRCNPETLKPVLSQDDEGSYASSETNALIGPDQEILKGVVYDNVQEKWDFQAKPFGLPESFCMGLGDISAGSSTPSMVKKVKAFLKTSKEAFENGKAVEDVGSKLWEGLGKWNLAIENEFLSLIQISKKYNYIYRQTIHLCESLPSEQWGKAQPSTEDETEYKMDNNWIVNEDLFGYLTDVFNVVPLHQEDGVEDEKLQMPEKLEISKNIITTLLRLKSLFLITRKALKTLGNCAGVPIEPPEQTSLCNSTMKLPGVLSCSVPGAGGHDAIVAIALGNNALMRIENHWLNIKDKGENNVCMMPLKAGIMYDGLLAKWK
eukprot:g2036.t1